MELLTENPAAAPFISEYYHYFRLLQKSSHSILFYHLHHQLDNPELSVMYKILKHSALSLMAVLAFASCGDAVDNDKATASADNNAAIENIMTRCSVRQYQADRTIPKDTVELLLRAAMAAPTAANKQPWQFIVIDERAALDSLAEALPYAKMLREAPLAIVTCGDLTKAIEDAPDFWIQDVSASTENLLLAAHALGLGAVWTGVYPNAERQTAVSQTLNLPSYIIPLAVVPVGYPNADQTPKDKWNTDNIHYNRW